MYKTEIKFICKYPNKIRCISLIYYTMNLLIVTWVFLVMLLWKTTPVNKLAHSWMKFIVSLSQCVCSVLQDHKTVWWLSHWMQSHIKALQVSLISYANTWAIFSKQCKKSNLRKLHLILDPKVLWFVHILTSPSIPSYTFLLYFFCIYILQAKVLWNIGRDLTLTPYHAALSINAR